jgi:hypothetical protein
MPVKLTGDRIQDRKNVLEWMKENNCEDYKLPVEIHNPKLDKKNELRKSKKVSVNEVKQNIELILKDSEETKED